jgi:predicted DNA-binding protein (MmcQ/YjbR family)
MSMETLRRECLSFPHVTEHIQWGDHLVFKVGGKSFLITSFEPDGNFASFKCSPERFRELIEVPGIAPAPYLARAHWVALEREDVVSRAQLFELARAAYDTVYAGLPRKVRIELEAAAKKPVPIGGKPARRSAPRTQKN